MPGDQAREPGYRFKGKCRSCGALIRMVWIKSGKWHPCDSTPQKVITTDGVVVAGLRSHFATCPNADQHRRGRS